MSEIYNGTFVLGNTSATTLSAGPGIKIDDSTPGVIKVSNDETVLYSITGTTVTALSANLSSPLTGFERVKINFVASEQVNRGWWFEYNTDVREYNANPIRTDDGGIVQAWGSYIPSNNYSTLTFNYGRYMVLQKSSTAQSFGNINFYITKVIGINRKQNGGN